MPPLPVVLPFSARPACRRPVAPARRPAALQAPARCAGARCRLATFPACRSRPRADQHAPACSRRRRRPPLVAAAEPAVTGRADGAAGESRSAPGALRPRGAADHLGGLHWRIYADKPDQNGVFRLVKEDRSAAADLRAAAPAATSCMSPSVSRSAAKPVQLRGEPVREVFEIPAGGLRVEGRVGDVRIPAGQISFDIYKGSQFEPGERRPLASNVLDRRRRAGAGGHLLHPVQVRRRQRGGALRHPRAGRQAHRRHRHASRRRRSCSSWSSRRGGEALANTDWAVLSPAGDTITESKGAFPRVILAEGEYR